MSLDPTQNSAIDDDTEKADGLKSGRISRRMALGVAVLIPSIALAVVGFWPDSAPIKTTVLLDGPFEEHRLFNPKLAEDSPVMIEAMSADEKDTETTLNLSFIPSKAKYERQLFSVEAQAFDSDDQLITKQNWVINDATTREMNPQTTSSETSSPIKTNKLSFRLRNPQAHKIAQIKLEFEVLR